MAVAIVEPEAPVAAIVRREAERGHPRVPASRGGGEDRPARDLFPVVRVVGGLDHHRLQELGRFELDRGLPRGVRARAARFRLLAALVVLGGAGRLLSLVLRGYPGKSMLFGLAMELIATPALTVWQSRVAAQARQ